MYYARAIDLTSLHALSAIASEQAKPTKQTLARVQQLLDYMATNPNAVVRFYASDMILNLHSDASYLSAGQGRSRAGGCFFLSSIPKDGLRVRTTHPPPLTKMSSRHPKGVRRLFFDEKLNLFKASFGVYGIKHQIDGNHLYYFSYFATFSNLFQKLLLSLVVVVVNLASRPSQFLGKTPIC